MGIGCIDPALRVGLAPGASRAVWERCMTMLLGIASLIFAGSQSTAQSEDWLEFGTGPAVALAIDWLSVYESGQIFHAYEFRFVTAWRETRTTSNGIAYDYSITNVRVSCQHDNVQISRTARYSHENPNPVSIEESSESVTAGSASGPGMLRTRLCAGGRSLGDSMAPRHRTAREFYLSKKLGWQ